MKSFPNARVIMLKIKRIRFLKSEKVFQKENSVKEKRRKVLHVNNFPFSVYNYRFSFLEICFFVGFPSLFKYGHKKLPPDKCLSGGSNMGIV